MEVTAGEVIVLCYFVCSKYLSSHVFYYKRRSRPYDDPYIASAVPMNNFDRSIHYNNFTFVREMPFTNTCLLIHKFRFTFTDGLIITIESIRNSNKF